MKLSDFQIDPKRKEEGAWISPPFLQGVKFKVRGVGNADWRRVQTAEALKVPYKQRVNGRLTAKQEDDVLAECILQAGLLDWKGLEDDDGKPLAYSPDTARELLFKPEFERLRDVIYSCCQMVEEIDHETVGEVEKN